MSQDREEPILTLRVPVSGTYWRDYGVPVGMLVVALLAVVVLVAERPADALTVGVAFLGLSAAAVLAGVAVYNVVVIALVVWQR